MTTTQIEVTPPARRAEPADEIDDPSDRIEVIENLDDLASTEVMLGCGDDNPYR